MVEVRKLGVSFCPHPSLVLLYKIEGSTKKRIMPIRELKKDSDCRSFVQRIKLRHSKYLETVPDIKIEKMLLLAKEHLKGHPLSLALDTVDQMLSIDPGEDLNKLSDKELKRRKDIMDMSFKKKNIDQDHPDFVYDKQVEFSSKKTKADWDESDDEEVEDETPKNSEKFDDLSPGKLADDTGGEEDFW